MSKIIIKHFYRYKFVVRLPVNNLWILSALMIASTASVYGNKLSFYVAIVKLIFT